MKTKKRLLSWLLCGAMLFSLCSQSVLAEGGTQDSGQTAAAGGLCEHHPEHDADCGYSEGTPETPCGHEHTEDCYTEVTECVHEHSEDCYPEETGDSVSGNDATPSDAQQREPENCPHICDEDSRCVTEKLNCQHKHDDECGYAPATEGTPCTYVCEICNPQDSGQPENKPAGGECICTKSCTGDNINEDCSVCGAEGADLTACKGASPATPSNALAITPEQVQEMINALPTAEDLQTMTQEEQNKVYADLQAAYDAYEALTDEQKAEITGAEIFESLFTVFNGMINALDTTHDISTGTLNISQNGSYTVTGTTTTNHIVVNEGVTATVTLNNVTITGVEENSLTGAPAQSAIDLGAGATLTLILAESSTNALTGGAGTSFRGAPGIHVPDNATLIIRGGGSLSVTGGSCNVLRGGPGIGGNVGTPGTGGLGPGENCGTVIILSSVTAKGGTGSAGAVGADIGGGSGNPKGGDGQGIRPVSGQENTYEVWGTLSLPEGVTIPEGAVLTGSGSLTSKLTQSAPGAPTLNTRTSTSVTLNAPTGAVSGKTVEYGYTTGTGTASSINNWTSSTTFNDLTPGTAYTFYARYQGNSFYNASEASDGTTIYTAHAAPGGNEGYTISYTAETVTAVTNYEVQLTGSNTWTTSGTALAITPGGTFQVRHAADTDGSPASDAATVNVKARPDAPTCQRENETVDGKSDGKITGLTAGTAYQISSDNSTWTDATLTGSEIINLAPGTYYVRVKATDSSFASKPATVTINKGAVKLSAPTNLTWNSTTLGKATWGEVTNASGYSVQLYKDGTAHGDPVSVTGTEHTFKITEAGGYTFKVKATSSADTYTDSDEAESGKLFTVSFDANGAGTVAMQLVADGGDVSEPDALTKTGYTFMGWYSDSGFTESNKWDFSSKTVSEAITLYAKWLSSDTGVTAVSVDGVTGEINGTTINVELPHNTTPPTDSSKIDVTVADGASKTPPTTSNDGATWTFTVTAADGSTKETYTINVSVNSTHTYGDWKSDAQSHWKECACGHKSEEADHNAPDDGDCMTPVTCTVCKYETKAAETSHSFTNYVSNGDGTETATCDHDGCNKTATRTKGGSSGGGSSDSGSGDSGSSGDSGTSGGSTDTPEAGNPFTDVHKTDWFYDDVMFVYENGLMAGTSGTTFSPYSNTTRAQIAVIFYRLAGSPEVTGESPFTDVKQEPGTLWYYNAVIWAQQSGIMGGYGNNLFGPNDPVTREQLASIFYSYAKYKGYDVSATGSLDSFTDKDSVSAWAQEAMKWAVGNGIINGRENNLLDPKGTATRAEIAAMLHRFIEKYKLVPAASTTGSSGTGGTSGWVQRTGSPLTGDGSHMGLWLFTLCTSAGALAALLIFKRREDEENSRQIA